MAPPLPLYLASSSPRRRQILTASGFAFELLVVPVDEDGLSAAYDGPLERLGEYLAEHKALAAREALRASGARGLVLASDTTVLLEGESLAKPRDAQDARRMLERLRGRTHMVATGVALASTECEEVTRATARTDVQMRDYGDDEVEAYVATGDPLDKAGSYSIQHPDFHPVEAFRGCHLGVIGLPVCIVAAVLGRGPLPPFAPDSTRCRWSRLCTEPLPTEGDVQCHPSEGAAS